MAEVGETWVMGVGLAALSDLGVVKVASVEQGAIVAIGEEGLQRLYQLHGLYGGNGLGSCGFTN